MPTITLEIPASLAEKLARATAEDKPDASSILSAALAQYFDVELRSLFQISTSNALIAGVSSGAVRVESLLAQGDFGLGNFADFDGGLVILDGQAYQVRGSGQVRKAALIARVPFAVVARFAPDLDIEIEPAKDYVALQASCDRYRKSGNIFFAVRLDGRFHRLRVRVLNLSPPGTSLIDATRSQSEFDFEEADGTLVGIWSPGFASAFNMPGYHFHFLSDDRQRGGHLLNCAAGPLRLRMQALTDFHLALPESESFLRGDLRKCGAGESAYGAQPSPS